MNYYIYQHIRLDTNQIFYIGKGTKKLKGNIYYRAYNKSSRNDYWKNITKLVPYKVEILEEHESEDECLKRETELIKLYGYSWNNSGILCNMVENIDEIRRRAYVQSSKKNSKEVHQYDLQGNYIKSFSSISNAKKAHPSDIYNVCSWKGKNITAGGFRWSTIKYDKLEPYDGKLRQIDKSRVVYQFDIYGNFIRKWKGTKEPSEVLGINRVAIRNCLCNLVKTSGGFKWSYSEYLEDFVKKYEVYKEDQLIFSHESLKKCAEHLSLHPNCVSVYLRRGKAYKGYIFKYHDRKTKNEQEESRS